jgi:hypothetical protein
MACCDSLGHMRPSYRSFLVLCWPYSATSYEGLEKDIVCRLPARGKVWAADQQSLSISQLRGIVVTRHRSINPPAGNPTAAQPSLGELLTVSCLAKKPELGSFSKGEKELRGQTWTLDTAKLSTQHNHETTTSTIDQHHYHHP